MKEYITVQGDTFDQIAKSVYGSELNVALLMKANPELCGVVVFSAGTRLLTPELLEKTSLVDGAPSWRRSP